MRIFSGTQPILQHLPAIILEKEDWNDWFTWYTLFSVQLVGKGGKSVHLGRVKIGHKGMSGQAASTQIPSEAPGLDDSYFSLGQDENYYETLISLGDEVREAYLTAMRDCAFSLETFNSNAAEPVMSNSLLRYVDESRVRERFHRLATGRSILTAYSFEYRFPAHPKAFTPPPILSFSVTPESLPATNIHVLIGRNGVGKSRCFDLLSRAFLGMQGGDEPQQNVGELVNTAQGNVTPAFISGDSGFAGLVTVSFSAFDSRGPLTGVVTGSKRYAYVGLVTHVQTETNAAGETSSLPRVKGLAELSEEFAQSVVACREGVRRDRWKKALRALESDPLFAEASVSELADDGFPDLEQRAKDLYQRRLSSGHAIVLLTITRLVQLVEEKSLVLIDEPESHLHPPLLSAFVRALSDLMIDRNGVALIATHSPVVLQEVPSSCAWKLSRAGYEASADRPEIETFGENVGVLTREIFGLEVTQTGFHRLIAEKARSSDYESIMAQFGRQLGAEARALARALSILPPPDSSVDSKS